ncbi:MAG: acyl-CoA dehydrogenase family protein [Dehalococcoidia bacterium]
MIEFTLTEEQTMLQRTLRDFVNKEIKPIVLERESIADPMERFPWDIVVKLSRMGIRTMALSKELGGSGADVLTCCLVGEELAVGDLGIAVIMDQTWKWVWFDESMNDEQRSRFLLPFLQDDTYLLGMGSTEPDADKGYEYFGPSNQTGTGPRTTARRDGNGGWVINGRKAFISNGSVAKLYVIQARTDMSKGGSEGVSAFLVPADTPGFTIGRVHDKIGQRLINNAELYFSDCWVPEANLLGPEGLSIAAVFGYKRRGRSNAQAAATTLGVGRAAFEAAVNYASSRVQGGKPIIQHQVIGTMLADMAIELEAARNLIWRAAWSVDHLDQVGVYLLPYRDAAIQLGGANPLPSMAKVFTSEVAVRACLKAMEIYGGFGIMREVGMEKYLRDAVTFLHSDGANQVLRLRIAELLASQVV